MNTRRRIMIILAFLLYAGAGIAASVENTLSVQVNSYLRKAPNLKSDTTAGVAIGDTLNFSEEKDGWFHVVGKDGAGKGWITRGVVNVLNYTKKTAATDTVAIAVMGTMVGKIILKAEAKLVSSPSPNAGVVKTLPKGQTLEYTGEKDGWYRILNTDGTEAGFISNSVAAIDSSASAGLIPINPEDTMTLGQLADSAARMAPDSSVKATATSSAEKATYTIIVPGRLEASSDAPVFDVPSTSGTFNHGVSFGAYLLYYEEQNGFFNVMNDKKEQMGWVTSSAVRILQKPETLTVVGDSARAMFVFDSVSAAVAGSIAPKPMTDTTGRLVFAKPDSKLKRKLVAFYNGNKRLVIAGGSILTGSLLLAVLLSGGDNSSSSTPQPGPGPSPPADDGDIPPIDVLPPSPSH